MDGSIDIGGVIRNAPTQHTVTTGYYSAVWYTSASGGTQPYALRFYTSSSRYKTGITIADDDILSKFDEIDAKHFYRNDENGNPGTCLELGFIAEDFNDAGLSCAVTYTPDGAADSLMEFPIIAVLWHKVKQLDKRIAELEGNAI
jgi:hypothetical protein